MEMHTDALRMLMEEQMNCEDPPLTQNLINSQLQKTNYISNDNVEDTFPAVREAMKQEPLFVGPGTQFSNLKRETLFVDPDGSVRVGKLKPTETEKCDDSDRENSDEFEETSLEMDSEQNAVAVATTAKFPVKINSEFLVCQAGHNMEYAKHLEVYQIIAFSLLVVKSYKSKMHKARQIAYQNDFNLAIKTGKEFANPNAAQGEQHLFLKLLEQYFVADKQCMMGAKGVNLFFSLTAKENNFNIPYQKVKKLMEAIGLKNCYLEGKLYYPNISLKLRDPHVKIA